jgi:hypothetical protein
MKLIIIGPGIMPIPPHGWGAVESLIWDYKIFIEKYYPDISVEIINTPDPNEIVRLTNASGADVIHIQYDNFAYLSNRFECKKVLLTSHYGYLDQMKIRQGDDYMKLIRDFIQSKAIVLCLSPSIANIYKHFGCAEERLFVQPNGANDEIFRFDENIKFPNRSIYLAKIDWRKKQYIYQRLAMIDFVGNYADGNFYPHHPNYKGEWSKSHLYDHLTDYANLVLLSDGEAHPLVCCEALICGLGLVISEWAAANLDTSLPFIDVIPNNKLTDLEYVGNVILKNQKISCEMRKEIREYGIQNFSWKSVVDKYVPFIKSL